MSRWRTFRVVDRTAAILLAVVAVACGTDRPPEREPAPRAGVSSPAPAPGGVEARDLVLVTIDTLRWDAVGFAGADVDTPLLDRLAKEGRRFPWAHAHNVVTLPSHANILTGRYPYGHGVRENSGFVLADDVPTLATHLADAGFRTAAFVGAFPLDSSYGLDRGFEVYDDRFSRGAASDTFVIAERRGDRVVEPALRWWREVEATGERRFLWVHLYDPHAPYEPEARFADGAGSAYHGEVAAVDAYLRPLLGPILDSDDDVLVALTADHGEALGDHGEATHGLFAYEATLRVPLVLWGAGIPPGVDERSAGHVDLLPTALAALGLEAPRDLPGRSLLGPPQDDRVLYFESLSTFFNRDWAPLRGVLAGREKWIELPLPELYDLGSDAAEAVNLVDERRRRVAALREAMPEEAEWPPRRTAISGEQAEALRSLGYLAGGGGTKTTFTAEDDPKNLVELDGLLRRAIDLYSRGRLPEAVAVIREAIARRPEMGVGYTHLTLFLRQLERHDEAIAVAEGALERGIDDTDLLRQLGMTLAEVGRGDEAVAILEPLAESSPEVRGELAKAYFGAGRLERARIVLSEILAESPDDAEALETLGAVALAAGRADLGRGYLERAVDLDPALPIAWNSLGVARYQLGDAGGALAAWQRSLELDATQLDALFNLGLVAADHGRPDVARRALRSFLDQAPPGALYGPDRDRARSVLERLG